MKIIRNIDGKKLELTLTNEEAMIQANIKAVQRRYVEGESLFTMRRGKIAQGQDVNDEEYFENSFFVTVLESLLTEHPEIIGTKLTHNPHEAAGYDCPALNAAPLHSRFNGGRGFFHSFCWNGWKGH